MTKTIKPVQDFTYFVYDMWGSQETWVSRVVNGCSLEPQARNHFWAMHEEQIRKELQPWLDRGYQVGGQINAGSIKVCLTKEYRLPYDIIDVLIWIMSFGVIFLTEMWAGQTRTMAVYRPIEFRVRLYCPPDPVFGDRPAIREEMLAFA